MAKILFFDIETTGVKYWRNGIHQIAGALEIDGEVVETFDFKTRPHPDCTIEPEALAIGGVTLDQVQAYPEMGEVYKQFTKMLSKHIDKFNKLDKAFLCGYNNAGFDDKFLRAWFEQNGDAYFGSYFWAGSVDVMVLATDYFMSSRGRMPNFKLHTVARALGITVDESRLHDASYDIELTRLMYQLIKLY